MESDRTGTERPAIAEMFFEKTRGFHCSASDLPLSLTANSNLKERIIMAKTQNSKKQTKKQPAKTAKEKKVAKQLKKKGK
jgi:hypothetical protein